MTELRTLMDRLIQRWYLYQARGFRQRFRAGQRKYERLIRQRKRWAVRLYKAGIPTAHIALILNCKPNTVGTALSQAGYAYIGGKWIKVE